MFVLCGCGRQPASKDLYHFSGIVVGGFESWPPRLAILVLGTKLSYVWVWEPGGLGWVGLFRDFCSGLFLCFLHFF